MGYWISYIPTIYARGSSAFARISRREAHVRLRRVYTDVRSVQERACVYIYEVCWCCWFGEGIWNFRWFGGLGKAGGECINYGAEGRACMLSWEKPGWFWVIICVRGGITGMGLGKNQSFCNGVWTVYNFNGCNYNWNNDQYSIGALKFIINYIKTCKILT